VPLSLTAAEILSLAPDSSSARSGQDLSVPRKWVSFAGNEQAVWGECMGSGKEPYRTAIDLSEPAFKCTCPSRKFPCKHGLGLFLLFQSNSSTITTSASPPAWVVEWLEKRTGKSTRKQQSPAPRLAPAAGGDAARAQVIIKNVTAGLILLRRWLDDLARCGLADLPKLGYSFWDGIAARMVDAQAPGAARLLRDMSGIPASGPGWHLRLLHGIAQLHLLIAGFENRSNLPDETVSDIKYSLGFTTSQDELLTQTGVADRWIVVGQRIVEEEKLRARRTWLFGCRTSVNALLLHFAHGQNAFETVLTPGMVIDAELVFYPSASPLRAVLKSHNATFSGDDKSATARTIDSALAGFSVAVSRHPWLERYPLALQEVVPFRLDTKWYVKDLHGASLPISAQYNRPWHFAAISGGRSVNVFGEFDGVSFWPLSVLTGAEVRVI
jgi:hypothetical protein